MLVCSGPGQVEQSPSVSLLLCTRQCTCWWPSCSWSCSSWVWKLASGHLTPPTHTTLHTTTSHTTTSHHPTPPLTTSIHLSPPHTASHFITYTTYCLLTVCWLSMRDAACNSGSSSCALFFSAGPQSATQQHALQVVAFDQYRVLATQAAHCSICTSGSLWAVATLKH